MLTQTYHIAFYTLIKKEARRTFRIWTQTLLPPAMTTALYFIIFGHVIGSRLGTMSGYPYPQFIAPGLIMMSVITSSFSSAVGSFFSAKFQRSIEELLVSPMPDWLLVAGFATGGMLRGLLVGIIVTVVSLCFTHLPLYSLGSIITVIVLSCAIFSLAGIINAVFAKTFDDIAIIPSFILVPLTYFGGVFYAIPLLPKIWQYLSLANPIVYLVSAFRYGFLGVNSTHVTWSYAIMVIIVALLYYVALKLVKTHAGLRH